MRKGTVYISRRLIEALRRAFADNGYDVPKDDVEWSRVVNDLLEEKIIEDFGEEYLESKKRS